MLPVSRPAKLSYPDVPQTMAELPAPALSFPGRICAQSCFQRFNKTGYFTV